MWHGFCIGIIQKIKSDMKAVIYARVSTDTGKQDTDRQIAQLTEYAAKNNITLVGTPFDDYQSGATQNKDRWVLKNCMAYCTNPNNEVDCVLITEVSRLGRDPWEMIELIKFFHDHHINVFFLMQNLYMFDDEGNDNPSFGIVFALFSKFAEQERSAIKERLQSGYKNYRQKGGKVGRKPGYRKAIEKYKEQYGTVVKKLKEGLSIRDVAAICNVAPSTVHEVKKRFNIPTKRKNQRARSMEDGV